MKATAFLLILLPSKQHSVAKGFWIWRFQIAFMANSAILCQSCINISATSAQLPPYLKPAWHKRRGRNKGPDNCTLVHPPSKSTSVHGNLGRAQQAWSDGPVSASDGMMWRNYHYSPTPMAREALLNWTKEGIVRQQSNEWPLLEWQLAALRNE